MKAKSRIHIGTSGWHYQHWKGSFYPADMPDRQCLGYYCRYFHTVEINNSFYNLPRQETLKSWSKTTPKGFCFAVKASRYITHMKKLKEPKQAVSTFLSRVETLGQKLGPILFQLPPHWRMNLERLESFLKLLPDNHRYTFEFRDTSWFDEKVYDLLRKFNAAFCIFHLAGVLSPKQVTADFAYVRLHGPAGAYSGQYNHKILTGWVQTFAAWAKEKKDVYCYFDNDQAGYAAQDAMKLQKMIA